ncbi:MAG: MbnP family protein [Chitinophagaceae bacterium]
MKILSKLVLICVLPVILLGAVNKNDKIHPADKERGYLTIRFDNSIGRQDLILNTANYVNAAGESFSISQLQYFVSNIKLGRVDGTEFTVPQDSSYFLVQENRPTTKAINLTIPAGDYNRVSFVLGVDSIRNTMNISKRTGVLDPASSMDNGMYWGWNSGYIFFKMEGTSQAAPADPTGQHKFRYHIGGFGGYSAPTINNIKTISLDLAPGGTVELQKGKKATIRIRADLLKVFAGSTNLSIAAHPGVMFSEYSVNVANNYSHMFVHDRTEK